MISALYAKLLVVMGLAFPMTEVISNHVPSFSYLVCSTWRHHRFCHLFNCFFLLCRVFICTCTLVPSPTFSSFSSLCWKIERPRAIVTSVSAIWHSNLRLLSISCFHISFLDFSSVITKQCHAMIICYYYACSSCTPPLIILVASYYRRVPL